MEHVDKVNYLRIALGFQNLGVSHKVADQIISTYEKVLELEGKMTLNDAIEIECRIDEKYKKLDQK